MSSDVLRCPPDSFPFSLSLSLALSLSLSRALSLSLCVCLALPCLLQEELACEEMPRQSLGKGENYNRAASLTLARHFFVAEVGRGDEAKESFLPPLGLSGLWASMLDGTALWPRGFAHFRQVSIGNLMRPPEAMPSCSDNHDYHAVIHCLQPAFCRFGRKFGELSAGI